MKSDMSRRFRTRVITNIMYSTVITCLVEVFLVTNLSMLGNYALKAGRDTSFLAMFANAGSLVTIVYVLIGIVMFAITFLLMQEKSIRYIDRISAAMQNISEGDLNTTVEVIGDDEFSGMAANLNKMVEDIRELMDKERESERTKNELITNVAHDLRTPLTSIEDLFGFTKLNYGKISMKISKVDIIKLLSQLLEEFYPNFEEKNLSYELQSNVPAKVISADGNLLARLFENLVGNAIKYGADGKRILVRVHATEQIVTVSVTNYGYVIPKDELPMIFDKFYRV